ncbi:FAD-dependent monooxygenase [Sciscionella marina]|uniref:FAD-dependent monooxygenase n=1 Tax=Sciscionella marina TaxID=508770 RepID=UPI000367736B|nr:FAD-dependent monooxygenase [Sciscionella marina]
MTWNILIAGAGIGGLAAALALHDKGFGVEVLESAREIRPLGVGLNIQPAAVAALGSLGIGESLAASGIPTAEHVYFDHLGERLFTEPRGLAAGHEWPQYSVHRGELQSLLLEQVRERIGPRAVRTGAQLLDVCQNGESVHARVLDRAGGEYVGHTGRALIGADGAHSVVRELLHPGKAPLRWNGAHFWRGITELDSFGTGRSFHHVSDARGTRVVAYPISAKAAESGRALVNWVVEAAVAEPGTPIERNWKRAGRLPDLLGHLDGWELDRLGLRELFTGGGPILEYPMVDRDPLPNWGAGRVSLLGDAAHLMYPVGANGASQAILDARALADALDGTEPMTGLREYERLRLARTRAVVLANRKMDAAEKASAGSADYGEQLAAITADYRRATTTGAAG